MYGRFSFLNLHSEICICVFVCICICMKLYVAVFEHRLFVNELSNKVLHRVPSVQRQNWYLDFIYIYLYFGCICILFEIVLCVYLYFSEIVFIFIWTLWMSCPMKCYTESQACAVQWQKLALRNLYFYLLAPSGALVVMMVYYISKATFSDFEHSSLSIMLQVEVT